MCRLLLGIGLFLLLIGLFEANVVVKSFAGTVPLGLFSGIGFGGAEQYVMSESRRFLSDVTSQGNR